MKIWELLLSIVLTCTLIIGFGLLCTYVEPFTAIPVILSVLFGLTVGVGIPIYFVVITIKEWRGMRKRIEYLENLLRENQIWFPPDPNKRQEDLR